MDKNIVMTLGRAATYLGYSPKSLQKLDREGVLIAHRTATDRRYYLRGELDAFLGRAVHNAAGKSIVAYCRVSSRAQIPDLKNQRSVIEDFCVARGFSNVEYIEEVGGGLNFKRPKFLDIIDRVNSGQISVLVLAHKDRMARFGFELIEHMCRKNSVELHVINSEKQSPEQEMVQDLMTIVHCFSSRLYGLRNYRKSLKSLLSNDHENSH